MPKALESLPQRQAKLESEIRNLTQALADAYSPTVMAEITAREQELSSIKEQLTAAEPDSLQRKLSGLGEWVEQSLSNLLKLLSSDPGRARAHLMRHVRAIVLKPHQHDGTRVYVATGYWDVFGNQTPLPEAAGDVADGMVAGVGFEPTTFGL